MAVTETDMAKAFLDFQYGEIKDLTKQFLTVVAGVLALSITFSEKIVSFTNAPRALRFLMMGSWALGLLAFTLGGIAIFTLYNSGMGAKYLVVRGVPLGDFNYGNWVVATHGLLILAGVTFVLALLLLVIAGGYKMVTKAPQTSEHS